MFNFNLETEHRYLCQHLVVEITVKMSNFYTAFVRHRGKANQFLPFLMAVQKFSCQGGFVEGDE